MSLATQNSRLSAFGKDCVILVKAGYRKHGNGSQTNLSKLRFIFVVVGRVCARVCVCALGYLETASTDQTGLELC